MTSIVVNDGHEGEIFLAYVERCLVPTLRRGDIVVMDNLPTHKVDGIEEAIKSARATLRYPPKYSPDLNPYRVALRQIQSVAVGGCRADCFESFQGGSLFRPTAQECANYFRYAGCAFV